MWFADAPLGLAGFVDVLGRESAYRRVILVIRASPCELLRRILIALEHLGSPSGMRRCSSAFHAAVGKGVVRLLSLQHALAVVFLTGEVELILHP